MNFSVPCKLPQGRGRSTNPANDSLKLIPSPLLNKKISVDSWNNRPEMNNNKCEKSQTSGRSIKQKDEESSIVSLQPKDDTSITLRSYQIELLEQAKRRNIIVYLGTGSGKTFIAVMLIKHMRDLINLDKKVVFLCNNVALLEQQADVIRKTTGHVTGTYCGAHGLDGWDLDKWRLELSQHQVLVMIHQVLLDALSRGYIKIPELALIIFDECHHATKNHSYRKIMTDWYHKSKDDGDDIPKILGLTASLSNKSVKEAEFKIDISKLEAVLDAETVTCDDTSNFVALPETVLVKFGNNSDLPGADLRIKLERIIRESKQSLLEVKNCCVQNIMRSTPNENTRATAVDSLKKDYKFFSNDILGSAEVLMDLGLFSLLTMKECLLEDLSNKYSRSDLVFYDVGIRDEFHRETSACLNEVFNEIVYLFDNLPCTEKEKLVKYSSSKVLKLMEILEMKGYSSCSTKEMRCIIFVERKLHARALQYLLWKMELRSVVDVGFIHSSNAGKNVKDPRDREDICGEKRKMSETLKKFREGKVNVLVSTSVVEEGIDVPSCNLVIKFDFPMTYRSYVQSRGRARQKDSKYFLMVEHGDKDKVDQYEEFLKLDEVKIKECKKNNSEDLMDLATVEDKEEHYSTTVARIGGTQALGLLHQYLQKITVDRFTRLTPAWTVKSTNESNQAKLWRGLGLPFVANGFTATIQLPHKTPIHFPVTGNTRSRSDLAKRSAALEVIKLLHQLGELTEDLKVKNREKIDLLDEDNDEDDLIDEEGRSGARKYYKVYPPLMMTDKSNDKVFLHIIELKLVKPIQNPRYKLHFPETDSHSLGLLTSSPLPLIGPLEIFGPSGLVHVHLRVKWKPITMSKELQHLAQRFHDYIFSHCLQQTSLLEQETSSLPLIVPVFSKNSHKHEDSRGIDWSMCENIIRYKNTNLVYNLAQLSKTFSYFQCFQDLVLYPLVLETTGPGHYFIEEVSPDLSVSTVMEGLGMSMKEYHKVHHQTKIKNHHQHLIRISSASKDLYMFSPGGEPVADGKKRTYRSYKVGELMAVEPIPAGLWKQAQMLPWILRRVYSLISALQFVNISWTEKQLSFDGIHSVKDDVQLRSKMEMEEMMFFLIRNSRFRDTDSSPSPGQIVQALTLASAGDNWDMERLEILGDAFLKYSTTIFLYYKMTDTCDEGDLTAARSRIVGNKNLMKIAKTLGLANCDIVSHPMDPVKTWIPPGYSSSSLDDFDTIEDRIVSLDNQMESWQVGQLSKLLKKEDLENLRNGNVTDEELIALVKERKKKHEQTGGVPLRSYRILSDKSQADCIEAMMGCYLYNCGMEMCLDFMASIGINLDSGADISDVFKRVRDKNNNHYTHFKPQKDAFVNEAARLEIVRFNKLINKLGVEEIENTVGYTFKEKSFLLEAFTHPSYEDNRLTHSYEKLEFLGDAVLDYLVSCYIFTHTTADPGRLTDIRSALVCNNMFASLLTDSNLDKFILHCNPGILNKINAYLDIRYENRSKSFDSTMKQFNEDDVPEMELIEVPKVLGDVLEAIIGAIYIDSGHDLETVWNVYLRLCPNLEAVVKDPPQNMKKELLEKYPSGVKFSKARVEADMVFIEAEVDVGASHKKIFRGRGKNKTLATLAACKCALRELSRK